MQKTVMSAWFMLSDELPLPSAEFSLPEKLLSMYLLEFTQKHLWAQAIPHLPCTLFSTTPSKWKLLPYSPSEATGCHLLLRTLSTYLANDN